MTDGYPHDQTFDGEYAADDNPNRNRPMNNASIVKIPANEPKPIDPEAIKQLVIYGDLKKLTSEQKVAYYLAVCESVGIPAHMKPFDYIVLNGKEQLYANKTCAAQLRANNNISINIVSRKKEGDHYIVSAGASMPNGKVDEDDGIVCIKGLAGENLSNAMMKAITKAKRRVTLSICGLGFLDETEAATITNGGGYNGNGHAKGQGAPTTPDEVLKSLQSEGMVDPDQTIDADADINRESFIQSCGNRDFSRTAANTVLKALEAKPDFKALWTENPRKAYELIVKRADNGDYDSALSQVDGKTIAA
jgi:hypothetical protein